MMKKFLVILLPAFVHLLLKVNVSFARQESSYRSAHVPEEFQKLCGDHASLEILGVVYGQGMLKFTYKYQSDDPKSASYGITRDTLKLNEIGGEYPSYPDTTPLASASTENELLQTNETNAIIQGFGTTGTFAFIRGFFFYKQANRLRLAGFNQQWLGCPQPLCIYALVDSAYTSNGRTFVVRGRYMWDVGKPPLSSNAVLFASENPNIPLYTDWAVTFAGEKYFGRGRRVYCEKEADHSSCEGRASGTYNVGDTSTVFDAPAFAPNHAVQAAFAIPGREVFLIHFTKTSEGFIRRFQKENGTSHRLRRFRDMSGTNTNNRVQRAMITQGYLKQGVDAAFTKDNAIYLLARNTYFKVAIEGLKYAPELNDIEVGKWFDGIEPHFSNEMGLFGCTDDIYLDKAWSKSRSLYKQRFPMFYDSDLTEESIKTQLKTLSEGPRTLSTRVSESQNSILPIALAVLLMMVLFVVVVIIVSEGRRRVRKMLKKKKKQTEKAVNKRKLKRVVAAHRSYLDKDILDSVYTPGKMTKGAKLTDGSTLGDDETSKLNTGSKRYLRLKSDQFSTMQTKGSRKFSFQ